MRRNLRALVAIVPLNYPERVEVQAHVLNAAGRMTGTGVIFTPEPWSVWRNRFIATSPELEAAEAELALGEMAGLGARFLNLPQDLFGRVYLLSEN